MAITNLNTIKSWFNRGLFPTEAQFASAWDSFWHKQEPIAIDSIENLPNALNLKADREYVDNLVDPISEDAEAALLAAQTANDAAIAAEELATTASEGVTTAISAANAANITANLAIQTANDAFATANASFKGKFTSEANLTLAYPSDIDGAWAIVDAGTGSNAKEYIYDTEEGWIVSSGTAVTSTDSVGEGSTNLYFTAARVLATVIGDLSGLVTNAAISMTDTAKQAFGKLQGQINTKQDKTDNTLQTTSKETTGAINELNAALASKAPQATTYNKTEVNAAINTALQGQVTFSAIYSYQNFI